MPFSFADHALIDSLTLSKFIFSKDDGATDLSTQNKFSYELMVNAISRQIMRYVSSNIKLATYTEVWDSAGSDELVPTERPIVSVSSVKISGSGDFAGASTLDASTVSFDTCSIKFRGYRLPAGRGMVQIVYEAGYETVPEDIQLAALLQFQWFYKKIGKGDGMVGVGNVSKSIGGGSESQSKDTSIANTGLIGEVIGLLKPYQRFEAPLSVMFARTS